MAVFYSKHFSLCFCTKKQADAAAPRATGLRREPRAELDAKPAAMALLRRAARSKLLRACSSFAEAGHRKRLGSSDDGILLKISSDRKKPGMILTAEGARIALGALQNANSARNCNHRLGMGTDGQTD